MAFRPEEIPSASSVLWTTSLRNVPCLEHSLLDTYFLDSGSGSAKARDDGMRLWMDEYVRGLRIAIDRKTDRFFVTAKVRPSMKKGLYTSTILLKADGSFAGAHCDFKSCLSGYCKQCSALLYHLWGLQALVVIASIAPLFYTICGVCRP